MLAECLDDYFKLNYPTVKATYLAKLNDAKQEVDTLLENIGLDK